MKIDFQRKVDRFGGALVCAGLSLVHRLSRAPSPPDTPRRILVILLSEMGSLVLGYGMFQEIRRRFPEAEIHALVFKKNREMLEILNTVPADQIHTIEDRSFFTLCRDIPGRVRTFRRLGLDAVIDCELFARISSILAFLSGAPLRAGFHPHTQEGLFRGTFINRPVLYNPYLHIGHQFINLVVALSGDGMPLVKRPVTAGELPLPTITLPAELMRAFTRRFTRDFAGIGGRRLVLIYPGGGALPIRAWPLPHYVALSRALMDNGYAVGIIGLDGDKPLAREIRAECGASPCIDLTGYTRSIRELMVLLKRASLLVTNDGGPGHFAAMTRVPTILFYGPETPVLYGPLGDRTTVFHLPLACSPCLTAYNHRNSPCDGDNVCLKGIRPETVIQKAMALLEKQTESA